MIQLTDIALTKPSRSVSKAVVWGDEVKHEATHAIKAAISKKLEIIKEMAVDGANFGIAE